MCFYELQGLKEICKKLLRGLHTNVRRGGDKLQICNFKFIERRVAKEGGEKL